MVHNSSVVEFVPKGYHKGTGMGNGSDVAKTAADYVTTSMEEDGIWNGCRHLKLI